MADDGEDIDVADLLARINANLSPDGDESSQDNIEEKDQDDIKDEKNITEGSEEVQKSDVNKETKANEFYIVRDKPEEDPKRTERDKLAEHADNINLVRVISSPP